MKTVLICSGKGGVGKSTLCAMLAIELAHLGQKVLAFDYDIGLRNLDILFGMQSTVVYNVMDYLQGDIELDNIVLSHPNVPNLSFLPSSQYAKQKQFSEKQLLKLIAVLQTRFDYMLIDAPAGDEKYLKTALQNVDTAIVVTTPDAVAMRDAEKILFEMHKRNLPTPFIVVNRVQVKLVKKDYQYSPKQVAQNLDAPLLGYIEEDIEVQYALNYEGLPTRSAKACLAANRIARRLLGELLPIPNIRKGFFWFRNKE